MDEMGYFGFLFSRHKPAVVAAHLGKLKGRCQRKQVSCEFNIHDLIQQICLNPPTNAFTPYCSCRKPPQARHALNNKEKETRPMIQ